MVAALAGKGCPTITERHYKIAIGIADVGVRRALELIPDISVGRGIYTEPRMKRELRELLDDLITLLRPGKPREIPKKNLNFELERRDSDKQDLILRP